MSAKLTIDGSAAGAVKAVEELNKAIDKVGKTADGAVAPSKRLQQEAQRIRESIHPAEKYNTQLERLAKLVQAGALSHEDGARKAQQYGVALERAGKAGNDAFGPEMLGNIKSMVAGMGGALAPLALMTKGFTDITEAIEKARAMSEESRRGMGSLRQLANTDAEFQNLKSKAETLYGTGATKTLDEAAGAVFSLASAGQLDDKSFATFAGLAQKGVVDPGSLAKAVRQYSSGFGAAEAGDTRAIISKAFAASAYSPATVEGLLGASPQLAAVSSGLKISDEESLASLAVLSSSVGENVAATQIRSFLTGTAKLKGFEGKGIAERVEMIGAKGLDIPGLQKELGTIEGVTGFQLLQKNLPEIRRAAADIDRANTDMGAVTRRLGFTDAESDAALSSIMIENQSVLANRREAAFEELRRGVFENQRQQMREDARKSPFHRANAAFDLGLSHTQEWVSGYTVSPETFANNSAAQDSGAFALNEQQRAVMESLERSAKAAEDTANEIRQLNQRNNGRVTTRQE